MPFNVNINKIFEIFSENGYFAYDVLNRIAVKAGLVGKEEKYLRAPLTNHCQSSLLFRCKVPNVYRKSLYDPVPRSMYFLTHQLFQRILTELSIWKHAKKLLSKRVNNQLCAKMYHEARLMSQLDYPFILRDVLAEYVMFCGYLGYPNFFHEDWIQAIMSWQSRSEYGCFTDGNYDGEFTFKDYKTERKQTSDELLQGKRSKKEVCLSHFTCVALSALTMSWDYLEDNCN